MNSRFVLWSLRLLFAALVGDSAFAQAPAEKSFPSDAEIRRILADRVGAEDQGIGLVVGLIDGSGRRVVAYGSLAKDDKRPLDGDTVFEIGSITKVFTTLLLMDMALKGEVAVTDPIAKFLPATARVPERDGKQITLSDLATQTSGLPRMPSNFKPGNPANPYVDYTPELLYAFLSGHQLTRDIGSKFEYSNLGMGLLGHGLSLRAGMDYEAALKARILEPLKMESTAVSFSPAMKARLAVGHGANLEPVSNWDLAALAGAGALRSSANDMLTFLAAHLGYVDTPLAAAMAEQLSIRRPAGTTGLEIAYGWFIQTKDGNAIIWHNGGTGGYRSFAGFDPKAKRGVVVLTNHSSPAGGDDIGRHLLDATYAVAKIAAPKKRVEVAVEPKHFDRYIGVYQLSPTVLLTMTREGDQLYIQLTGQPKAAVFPEGEGKFFLKVVDAQLTFPTGSEDKAAEVVLHQGGRDRVAKRIDEAQAATMQAAIAARIQDQRAAPGSEAALRRNIEDLRRGAPNYDLMAKGLADITRRQLPKLTESITQLGTLESITFKSVAPGGVDIYEVKFEHGSTEWRIGMESEEIISGVGFRKL
jgi:D-alanyl-D-alanine-carboxypeptidase/D-alanyl-D-alanine-endopeptidase